jgi:hypothetical protein
VTSGDHRFTFESKLQLNQWILEDFFEVLQSGNDRQKLLIENLTDLEYSKIDSNLFGSASVETVACKDWLRQAKE